RRVHHRLAVRLAGDVAAHEPGGGAELRCMGVAGVLVHVRGHHLAAGRDHHRRRGTAEARCPAGHDEDALAIDLHDFVPPSSAAGASARSRAAGGSIAGGAASAGAVSAGGVSAPWAGTSVPPSIPVPSTGTISSATRLMILMSGLTAGPAVSL